MTQFVDGDDRMFQVLLEKVQNVARAQGGALPIVGLGDGGVPLLVDPDVGPPFYARIGAQADLTEPQHAAGGRPEHLVGFLEISDPFFLILLLVVEVDGEVYDASVALVRDDPAAGKYPCG